MNSMDMYVENNDRSQPSNQSVLEQLQKILNSPDFAVSGVMSRFLSYVVNQTISCRSGEIKEYNIGIDVLKKSPLYKTSISGVVRVHAMRLRIALDKYYKTHGLLDKVIISIPKGRYVPLFERCEQSKSKINLDQRYKQTEKIKLAVLPFSYHGKNEQALALSENLILLLNTELGLQKNVNVLSGYTAGQFIAKKLSLKKMAMDHGVKYLVTGSMHCENSLVRVYAQLTDVKDENQIWSQVYTFKYETTGFFRLEDRVVSRIMKDLTTMSDIFKNESNTDAEAKLTKNKVYFIGPYASDNKNYQKRLRQI